MRSSFPYIRIQKNGTSIGLHCLAFAISLTNLSAAEEGVTDKTISVGQCAALQGPAMGLGTGMNMGMSAFFKQWNAKGGAYGRTIELNAIDDGYEPEKTGEGTSQLIEEKKVFCLAGYVGTPTGKAAMEIVQESHVPLIGLFTGAMAFRDPVKRYIINLRASYDDETDLLIERLTKDLGIKSVSVMYQNDAFGQAGLSGTEKALAKRGLALSSKGTFERNTLEIKSGLAKIIEGKPEAVIMVGPYKPLAAFVKEAKLSGLKVKFATISFVGTENFILEAGQYVSLEGYATAKMLATGIEKTGKNLTREGLIDAFESMTQHDLGGLTLSLSKNNHQGSGKVFLTEVYQGDAKTISVIAKIAAR